MLAVDTNVVVRYLLADDREQFARARALIDKTPVLVLRTVILEIEWVLRGVYKLSPSAIEAALRRLSGLPTVTIEAEADIAGALTLMSQGMDFADALHLVDAQRCEAFATFDKALARCAARTGQGTVRLL